MKNHVPIRRHQALVLFSKTIISAAVGLENTTINSGKQDYPKQTTMNRLLTILLLASLLWACNNHPHSDNIETSDSIESDHQPNEMTAEKLSLMNGVRWKVDSATNRNAKNLLFIVEKFNSGSEKSMAKYQQVAVDLQLGLNKMIGECKMKGADHQALHKWLEPLIQQVTVFKQTSTKEDAVRSLEVIHTQLNLFAKFFE